MKIILKKKNLKTFSLWNAFCLYATQFGTNSNITEHFTYRYKLSLENLCSHNIFAVTFIAVRFTKSHLLSRYSLIVSNSSIAIPINVGTQLSAIFCTMPFLSLFLLFRIGSYRYLHTHVYSLQKTQKGLLYPFWYLLKDNTLRIWKWCLHEYCMQILHTVHNIAHRPWRENTKLKYPQEYKNPSNLKTTQRRMWFFYNIIAELVNIMICLKYIFTIQ